MEIPSSMPYRNPQKIPMEIWKSPWKSPQNSRLELPGAAKVAHTAGTALELLFRLRPKNDETRQKTTEKWWSSLGKMMVSW